MRRGRLDKERRRKDHEERMEYRKTLTPTKQLQRLNQRLGMGIGARKERERLLEQLTQQD